MDSVQAIHPRGPVSVRVSSDHSMAWHWAGWPPWLSHKGLVLSPCPIHPKRLATASKAESVHVGGETLPCNSRHFRVTKELATVLQRVADISPVVGHTRHGWQAKGAVSTATGPASAGCVIKCSSPPPPPGRLAPGRVEEGG